MYLLNPPAHGHPDDGDERPPFVLLEPYAYFVARDNATTATCEMRGFKGTFELTFCTTRPPLVSYMCFHAREYDHTSFAVEPQIIATETDGGLVLLHVVFGDHPSAVMFPCSREYLVYDASGPSLTHLPHPGGLRFSDESLAFLRPFGSTTCYILAAHSGGFGYVQPSELYMYRSDKEVWAVKPLILEPNPSLDRVPYHSTCKAITIGGNLGTVAWVDLWHNIILCDLLIRDPKLRSLELPLQNMLYNEITDGNPRAVRDIALVDGLFKYVEMEFHDQPESPALVCWEATVWSTKTSSSLAKDWVIDYRLESSEIPETSLPELRVDPGRVQPTLLTLHIGLPNLSLQDDGIVYFLSKICHWDSDHVPWVLTVDMRNKTIPKVDEFSRWRTLGLAEGYNASSISKYLKGTE